MTLTQTVAHSQATLAEATPRLAYRKVNIHGLFKHKHSDPFLRAIAFSPDGALLGGAFDRRVIIWRLEKAGEDHSPGGFEEWAPTVVFSLDDNTDEEISFFSWTNTDFLLIASTSGDVKIGQFSKGFQVSAHPIKSMALHQNGALLALAAADNELTGWQANRGGDWEYVSHLRQPDHQRGSCSDGRLGLTHIAWKESEDRVLVVTHLNHGIFAWDMASMECRTLLNQDKVLAATLSPDDRYIAIPGRHSTFQIFDLETKIKANTLAEPADEKVGLMRTSACPGQFVHDGQYFLGAGLGKINIWNAKHSIRAQRLDLGTPFCMLGLHL
ncbi:WD40 repeat-like protein [Coprinellus micaceus]|uniref:WD40 repeat-like protein n=1 Tax=Coprinellus micaceus TaxID=71717 RepID=A0A4Y7SBM3_COPMI|nr:WD40 repeat-like protein [Coprinellus micaceus]